VAGVNSETVRAMAAAEALGDAEVPQDYYFTFGSGHALDGVLLLGRYVRIHGTYMGARMKMIAAFGNAWAFQYDSADATGAGVEKYGLRELPLPQVGGPS
jgi:hypothetical protein